MFFSKLTKRVKPFYKLLRKTDLFSWDEAGEPDFLAFKKDIVVSLILSRPKPGASLLLYFSVAVEAISSALVQ